MIAHFDLAPAVDVLRELGLLQPRTLLYLVGACGGFWLLVEWIRSRRGKS